MRNDDELDRYDADLVAEDRADRERRDHPDCRDPLHIGCEDCESHEDEDEQDESEE